MKIIKKIVNKVRNQKMKKRKKDFKYMGNNVEIQPGSTFGGTGNIEIVYIGPDGFHNGDGGIKIGSDTILAHRVSIMTRNHNYNSDDLRSIPYDSVYILKPAVIGENIWIGSNVNIILGITIGEGVVIGMGSVITKGILPF